MLSRLIFAARSLMSDRGWVVATSMNMRMVAGIATNLPLRRVTHAAE